MSAAFIVDCSLATAWRFHDDATPKAAALLNRVATETAACGAEWLTDRYYFRAAAALRA